MGRSGDIHPSVVWLGRKIGRWQVDIPGGNLTFNRKDLEGAVWLFIMLREFTSLVEKAQLVEVEVTAGYLVETSQASEEEAPAQGILFSPMVEHFCN